MSESSSDYSPPLVVRRTMAKRFASSVLEGSNTTLRKRTAHQEFSTTPKPVQSRKLKTAMSPDQESRGRTRTRTSAAKGRTTDKPREDMYDPTKAEAEGTVGKKKTLFQAKHDQNASAKMNLDSNRQHANITAPSWVFGTLGDNDDVAASDAEMLLDRVENDSTVAEQDADREDAWGDLQEFSFGCSDRDLQNDGAMYSNAHDSGTLHLEDTNMMSDDSPAVDINLSDTLLLEDTTPTSKLSHPFNHIRYEDGSTFKVTVGKAPLRVEHYILPVSVFIEQSDFFHTALQSSAQMWLAGKIPKPISLEHEDPAVFSSYLEWVRYGPKKARDEIANAHYDEDLGPDDDKLFDKTFEALIKLHALASKLQDYTIANKAIDIFCFVVSEYRELPRQGPATLAYKLTTDDDLLRALVRDIWAYSGCSLPHGVLDGDDLPYDLLRHCCGKTFDLLQRKMQTGGHLKCSDFKKGGPQDGPTCLYHRHDNKHVKYPRCTALDHAAGNF